MKKMTLNLHMRVISALYWSGIVITFIGSIISEPLNPHWLFWIGIVVFLASPVYRLFTIRCPHCGSNLFSCKVMPEYCPDCGKELAQQPKTDENAEK
jgi:hypothetical protein